MKENYNASVKTGFNSDGEPVFIVTPKTFQQLQEQLRAFQADGFCYIFPKERQAKKAARDLTTKAKNLNGKLK